MKLPYLRPSRRSGFTLVELLVVIAIIAILASITVVAVGSVLNSAKRAKANAMASQLQTAALNYYTEYSVYPTGTPGTDYTINDADQADWGNLVIALSGNINPHDGTSVPYTSNPTFQGNTRSIPFLTLKSSDVAKTGDPAPLNPLPTGGANYFNIAMDSDYDGVLGAGTSAVSLLNFATATPGSDPQPGGTSTAGVAVWANCNGTTSSKNPSFWVHTY